jgi:hypothetical protein
MNGEFPLIGREPELVRVKHALINRRPLFDPGFAGGR